MASNGEAINVIDPAKQAKKGAKYLNDGTLHASHCYIEENPTFSDVSAMWCVYVCSVCMQYIF